MEDRSSPYSVIDDVLELLSNETVPDKSTKSSQIPPPCQKLYQAMSPKIIREAVRGQRDSFRRREVRSACNQSGNLIQMALNLGSCRNGRCLVVAPPTGCQSWWEEASSVTALRCAQELSLPMLSIPITGLNAIWRPCQITKTGVMMRPTFLEFDEIIEQTGAAGLRRLQGCIATALGLHHVHIPL